MTDLTPVSPAPRPSAPVSCVLAFDDEHELATHLAQALDAPLRLIERHRFPDGELKLTVPGPLQGTVVLLRSLHQPNEKLVELLLAAPTTREQGAQSLLLVCPYLAYMRQDIAFRPGEAVSQRHVLRLLGTLADGLLTLDPHLHRIARLDEVLPASCQGLAVSAAGLLGAHVRERVRTQAALWPAGEPLLLGPDEESAQWVREAARAGGFDHGWCVKDRRGDREVHVTLPATLAVHGRSVVLIDDMASTGRTLVEAARLCLAAGAASVDVAVTHALFVGDAIPALHIAGIRHVWSTDSVQHPSHVIPVAGLLAQGLRQLSQAPA